MKIEVGKFYKTSDGRKKGPLYYIEDPAWHKFTDGVFSWGEDGGAYSHGRASVLDLIAEWTDTPEVGTLQEIGAKVGDVVSEYGSPAQEIVSYFPLADEPWTLKRLETGSVDTWYGDSKVWRIISRAQPKPEQTGPVRTVTRTAREIVPGVYGRIVVDKESNGDFYIDARNILATADDLTVAISTLTAIRDALKENGE